MAPRRPKTGPRHKMIQITAQTKKMPQCISSFHMFCSLIGSRAIKMSDRSGSMHGPPSRVQHRHPKKNPDKQPSGKERTRINRWLSRNGAVDGFLPPVQVQETPTKTSYNDTFILRIAYDLADMKDAHERLHTKYNKEVGDINAALALEGAHQSALEYEVSQLRAPEQQSAMEDGTPSDISMGPSFNPYVIDDGDGTEQLKEQLRASETELLPLPPVGAEQE